MEEEEEEEEEHRAQQTDNSRLLSSPQCVCDLSCRLLPPKRASAGVRCGFAPSNQPLDTCHCRCGCWCCFKVLPALDLMREGMGSQTVRVPPPVLNTATGSAN